MKFNQVRQFEYALSFFSEINHKNYQFTFEYLGKHLTASFLNFVNSFPISSEYDYKFDRQDSTTSGNDKEYDLIYLRHLIADKFNDLSYGSNKISVPETIDLINAINSIINDFPENLTFVDNFNLATNVTFLESNLHFDSYRFPDNSEFNIVSVQDLDN